MGKRIESIDAAKGISISLVALYHSELARHFFWDLTLTMGLFRIPLFFFLSGVFFSASSKPTDFILKKSDALLKPFFVTLFFLLFVSILSEETNITRQAMGIFYGNGHTIRWVPMWFLTHLWLLFIVSYIVFRYTKLESQPNFVKILLVFCLVVIGSFLVNKFWFLPVTIFGMEKELPGLPFSIDLVILSMAFFVSGYFLNRRVKEFTPNVGVLLSVILIFSLIANGTDAAISFHWRVYNQPMYATLAAICGIYIVLSVSHYMCKNKYLTKIFTIIGSASLFVLIFHYFIGAKTFEILNYLLDGNSLVICCTLSFVASIIVPLIIRTIMLRSEFLMLFYFPLKTNKLFHRLKNTYRRTVLR